MTNAHNGSLSLPAVRLDCPPLSRSHGPERLGLGSHRDGWLVPSPAPGPRPLWIAFHGAGASAQQMVTVLKEAAGPFGAHLLAIDSRRPSWDLLVDDAFGADTAFLQAALEQTFGRVWVDPAAIVALGYSDGASYALSLALRNAALFSQVIAYAPGFAIPGESGPYPSAYVSHGRNDTVLPVAACGRRVAAQLEKWGVDVTYEEHDGSHALTPAVVAGGFAWLAARFPLGITSERPAARGANRRA